MVLFLLDIDIFGGKVIHEHIVVMNLSREGGNVACISIAWRSVYAFLYFLYHTFSLFYFVRGNLLGSDI